MQDALPFSKFIQAHFRALTPLAQLQFTQEESVTYEQMDSLANGLAHNLLATGVDRRDLIGLFLEPSFLHCLCSSGPG
jgi:non-ribosomal peptide synthetase component F